MEVPRGQFAATAASLHYSHSNAGSELHLWPTYTTAHGNTGALTHWARTGIEPTSSWMPVRFVNWWTTMGTPELCILFHIFFYWSADSFKILICRSAVYFWKADFLWTTYFPSGGWLYFDCFFCLFVCLFLILAYNFFSTFFLKVYYFGVYELWCRLQTRLRSGVAVSLA